MGLLARLWFGTPLLPTDVGELHVDVARLSICGLQDGDTRDEILAALGPPTSLRGASSGSFFYANLGLEVAIQSRGKIGFTVFPTGREGVPLVMRSALPFRGLWQPFGTTKPPTEEQLVSVLGTPSSRETDERDDDLDGPELWWGENEDTFVVAQFDTDGVLIEFLVEHDDSE